MVFSGYIVAYLFFAGAGAAAFLIALSCAVVDAVVRSARTENALISVQSGFLAAPVLLIAASAMLLIDVGMVERVWLLFVSPFQSILSVGAWLLAILVAVCCCMVMLAVSYGRPPRAAMIVCCLLGAPCSVGVILYTGILLSGMVSVDFWRTPWLVALFACSSLACGFAVIIGIESVRGSARRATARMHAPWRASALVGVLEICVLAAFIAVQSGFTDASAQSCALLMEGGLSPVFWGAVVAAGMVLPLAVHAAFPSKPAPVAGLIASAGVLAGGFALRYCIVAAAVLTPVALGI